jgi:nucleotide-binding universal stress UspA family protein
MAIAIKRVLVATDFSKAGQRAVEEAAEWARDTSAQLRIVHVTPPKRWLGTTWRLKPAVTDSIERHAASALKQAAERADPERRLELSTAVLSGPAARSIARAARDYAADLLVVGARGERDAQGQQVLGVTSSKLLGEADIPLLLVRRPHKDPVAGVVVGLDLSARSRSVLEWADLAAAGRHLYAYHVYNEPFAARLEAYGLAASAIDVYSAQARSQCDTELASLIASIDRTGVTSRAVERGDPAEQLRRYIDDVRPSLVVLGKHVRQARSSPASSVASVCRFVANFVSSDVLVV